MVAQVEKVAEDQILIRLADVPKLRWLPKRRAGSRLNISTLFRWSNDGCRTADGQRIRLRVVRVGGALCTCELWLRQFFVRLASDGGPVATADRGGRTREV